MATVTEVDSYLVGSSCFRVALQETAIGFLVIPYLLELGLTLLWCFLVVQGIILMLLLLIHSVHPILVVEAHQWFIHY